jgi:small conductance mechanosensitive channel
MFDTDEIATLVQNALASWGLKIVAALAILAVGRIIAGVLRGAIRRALGRTGFDATLTPFIANLVYAVVMVGVFYGAAAALGIPMNGFVAMIGAAGLAVALAFQGTLSNFASVVMLLTFRPFKLGDFVDAGGIAGTVKEIGVFTTTLATPDNVKIIMPNSAISGQTIKNFSANETRRVDLVVGVSYDDDLNVAMEVIHRVLGADGRVLEDPAPVVAVSEMGASSVDLVVRPWCNSADYWQLKWSLTKALKEEIEAAGLSIPYPQRDVHLHPQET